MPCSDDNEDKSDSKVPSVAGDHDGANSISPEYLTQVMHVNDDNENDQNRQHNVSTEPVTACNSQAVSIPRPILEGMAKDIAMKVSEKIIKGMEKKIELLNEQTKAYVDIIHYLLHVLDTTVPFKSAQLKVRSLKTIFNARNYRHLFRRFLFFELERIIVDPLKWGENGNELK